MVAAKIVAAKNMPSYRLDREQWLLPAIDEVFFFVSRPENLPILAPPGLEVRTVESPPTEICQWNPLPGFVDCEIKGPYALWHHENWFELGDGGTSIRDRVTYALPFGFLGKMAYPVVRCKVEKIFDFRAQTMPRLFPP